MGKLKMDVETAKYVADKARNDSSVFPMEFEECEQCGALYIKALGHDCGNTVEVPTHDVEE